MSYKLTDKIDVRLRKITPKLLKEARELGLWDKTINTMDAFEKISDYILNEEGARKVINLLFEINDKDLEQLVYEDLDIEELIRGYWDFFYKLPTVLTKSEYFSKILKSSD